MTHAWSSRHHRKGLKQWLRGEATEALLLSRCLWRPHTLNWWIGSVFAVGSLLFVAGSLLSLVPSLASTWSFTSTGINAVFAAGSIPFTTAAYLQLFQAANAPGRPGDTPSHPSIRSRLIGWRPHNIGWLSCLLQFVGTVLFNINTFDAMLPSMSWWQQDLVIWIPDLIGSVLFLASGYLAYAEVCRGYYGWKPGSLSWWVTAINLCGCVGFMISALFAFVLPGPSHETAIKLALMFTLQGAVCFFLGSCLMVLESGLEMVDRKEGPVAVG